MLKNNATQDCQSEAILAPANMDNHEENLNLDQALKATKESLKEHSKACEEVVLVEATGIPSIVDQDRNKLKEASKEGTYYKEKEVVLAAVNQKGRLLKYVKDEFKNNK